MEYTIHIVNPDGTCDLLQCQHREELDNIHYIVKDLINKSERTVLEDMDIHYVPGYKISFIGRLILIPYIFISCVFLGVFKMFFATKRSIRG